MILWIFETVKVFANIDDTENLRDSGVLAVPKLFGLSSEEGLKKYPNFYYPPCDEIYPEHPKDQIFIDYRNNLLTITCPANSTPYVVYPTDQKIQLTDSKEIKEHTIKTDYFSDILVENWVEYALGSCEKTKYSTIQERFLRPRFKKQDYMQRLNSSKRAKKMIILFICIDSFSRRHFYRKLKKTNEYLKALNNYSVVDFKLHNIIGSDTATNQIHVFLNNKDPGFSIWQIMKSQGFMTLWGTDGCSSNVPRALGNNPDVDHVVATFYCANLEFGFYETSKFQKFEQRCMGSKMAHVYLMNYTQEFSMQYSNTSQWVYNHFTAAHEASGQHAQTLDLDLKEYIEWFIERFGDSHNLVIFLNGDHGMRYGEHMAKTPDIQEFRLPACFVIGKKDFFQEIGKAGNLEKNSWRLTSKPDLRESMAYLAMWQGKEAYHSQKIGLNLFTEEIGKNRSCKDAGVPPWLCCYLELEPGGREIAEIFLGKIVESLNFEIMTKGLEAKKLEDCQLVYVEKAEVIEKDGGGVVVKMPFMCKPKNKVFNVWVYVSEERVGDENVVRNSFLPSFPVFFVGRKMFWKVVHCSDIDVI